MTTIDIETPRRPPGDELRGGRRPGDRIFSGLATGAGITILAVLAGVAGFLLVEAWPALSAPAEEITGGEGLVAYIAPLAFGTVLAATLACLIAIPLAMGVALYITDYAPRRIAGALAFMVDLLAAVPSIVYGLWGITVLGPLSVGLARWLEANLGFLPFFAGPASPTGRTMLVASVVLAVMILPIITAVTREVYAQTPRGHREAAFALGATRWEMIRMTVLPFGRSGLVSATMLGLGRALGETMAVTIILSVSGGITFNLIGTGNAGTIAADIALNFPEAAGLRVNVLIASGLALFLMTLAVNMIARYVIDRRRAFAGANG